MIFLDIYLIPCIFPQRRCCPACFTLRHHSFHKFTTSRVVPPFPRPTNTIQSRYLSPCIFGSAESLWNGSHTPAFCTCVWSRPAIPPRPTFCNNPISITCDRQHHINHSVNISKMFTQKNINVLHCVNAESNITCFSRGILGLPVVSTYCPSFSQTTYMTANKTNLLLCMNCIINYHWP